ncbi:uncharacterized protein LOC144116506 [Amblyomma americanum]
MNIEKHVLSILDAVRDTRIQARPAVSSLRRIAAPVREATLPNWLEPLQAAFWWGSFDENTSVSVQDVRVLLAADQLLLSHSSLDLLEQLSWWLVQRLTALGWPQGYIAVAGGKEVANHTVKEDCYSLAATRFGLLLASESAVKLFTRDSRRQAQAFLRDLLTVFRELAASASWLSEKARAVVNKTLQELQIVLWPPDVAISKASLWQLYSNFCFTCETAYQAAVDGGAQAELAPDGRPTAMDHWMHANRAFSRLDPSLRERMQILWQGGAAEPFVFEHWKNRLRVSHAAVGTPLYHVTSAEGGGEEANYGGLGAAFLSHVLRSFDPPAENIDDNLVPWIEISGAAYKAGSLKCGADFIPNLREIAALGIAWHALKKRRAAAVKGSDSDGRRQLPATALSIPDSNGEVHVYTGDQLFFLNHCRSRCRGQLPRDSRRGEDCNVAVRHVRDFGPTFGCATRRGW